MTKKPIGFRLEGEEAQTAELTEDTIDLNDGLIDVVNYLVEILAYYKKSIKGVTVDVNSNGKYSVKIKY